MSAEFNPTLAYLYRRWLMRRLLQPVVSGRFLEIGVGSGNIYEDLVGRGCRGLCLDLNPRLIREHRQRSSHPSGVVEFRTQDFFQVEGPFDLVLAFEVLEHYLDDRQCLDRWRELLAPDGTLLFSVPAHRRRWTSNDTRAGHARQIREGGVDWKAGPVRPGGGGVLLLWIPGIELDLSALLAPVPGTRRDRRRDRVRGFSFFKRRRFNEGFRANLRERRPAFRPAGEVVAQGAVVATLPPDATSLSEWGCGHRLHGEMPKNKEGR